MTAKSTPAEIAQRSLDAAQKRVDRADDAILKLTAELVDAKAEKWAAVSVRDYRKDHPALRPSSIKAPPSGTGTEQGFLDGEGAS